MQKQCGEMRKKYGLSTLNLGPWRGTLGGTRTRGQTTRTANGRALIGGYLVGNKREDLKGALLR